MSGELTEVGKLAGMASLQWMRDNPGKLWEYARAVEAGGQEAFKAGFEFGSDVAMRLWREAIAEDGKARIGQMNTPRTQLATWKKQRAKQLFERYGSRRAHEVYDRIARVITGELQESDPDAKRVSLRSVRRYLEGL